MGTVKHTCFILAALLFLITGCDRGSHPRQMGRVAPDFTVTDGNRSVHLADYRGKIVVLNFWATWCLPCIAELPSLTAMQRQLPQVQVLAVSVDVDQEAYGIISSSTRSACLPSMIRRIALRIFTVLPGGRRRMSSINTESSAGSLSARRTGPAPRSWNTSAACSSGREHERSKMIYDAARASSKAGLAVAPQVPAIHAFAREGNAR